MLLQVDDNTARKETRRQTPKVLSKGKPRTRRVLSKKRINIYDRKHGVMVVVMLMVMLMVLTMLKKMMKKVTMIKKIIMVV